MFSIFTTETQVCIVLVVFLLTILVSGWLGWKLGWDRAVDFMMNSVDKKMAKAIEEVSDGESNHR